MNVNKGNDKVNFPLTNLIKTHLVGRLVMTTAYIY